VTETAGDGRPGRPVRRRRPRAPVLQGSARASAHVCQAASCLSAQSDQVFDALVELVTTAGLSDVAVKRVGCLGLCAAGPLVEVPESGRLFQRVGPDDLGGLVGELQAVGPGVTPDPPAPFFAGQVRVVTENSGRVDPEDLDDYRARSGYRALETALHSMSPAEVVDQVVRSGLRGRGGAGYPTGLKWTTVAKAPGTPKYVICNADEGDPGAFMDRSVLESDPHRVAGDGHAL
jgi:bidirectional [NiFe] hydrogenase diaphorase subunit